MKLTYSEGFISFKLLASFFISVLLFVSCNPGSTLSYNYKQGVDLQSRGELDSAQFIFEGLLALDSNDVNVINHLADVYFRKVEIGKSLAMLNKSKSIDSLNAETYLKIAEINLLLGKYNDVFSWINKGLKIDERKPKAYFMKGVAYKYIKDTAKAISSFKTATELEKEYAQVYYELGLLLTLQNDSTAIDYYKRGISTSPNDVGLKLSLAWAYDKFGKVQLADYQYLKTLQQTPDFPSGKYNYAIFKRKLGELDTALVLCDEALDHDANNYEVLNLKGLVLHELGKDEEALLIKDQLNKLGDDVGF